MKFASRRFRQNLQRVLNFIGLIVLAALAAAIFYGGPKSEADIPEYNTATVAIGNIEENVTSQGKLEPKEYVDIGVQVTGQLKRIYVAIGDNVRAGQLLAEIDPRIYAARVQADQARMKTLEAQLREQHAQIILAGQRLSRNRQLIASRAVSQEVLQSSEANLKVAQARAASIQAQMEEVQSTLSGNQANLSFTKIYAPMDATVVQQIAREGQTLNANQQTPMLLQLAKLDVMTVRAQVAEADIPNIKPEQSVYFTTLGDDQRRWTGIVRQILPSPEVINDVVLYNVLVDVDNQDRRLMSGMSTQMFFVMGQARQVPLVPVAALGKRLPENDNDQGKAYRVKVVGPGGIEERIVRIGLKTRRLAEVRQGLNSGDRVITLEAKPAAGPERSSGSTPRRFPHL
ncbi:MAG: efflux RND transporter periplasmic adaptor subunit [Methylococcaceae bacterium]|nr:efflux RND transporter periplasmic adaptor subunit [Methylococcaceae bacterium]